MLYNAPGLFFDDKSDRNAQELLKLLKLNLTIAHVVVTSIIAEYFDNINWTKYMDGPACVDESYNDRQHAAC